ncbi:hypothetical protein TWF696_005272 [Orbilia brochopaga]|uniref:RNA-directed RNA polymerase n=1 Tax=Orbilia brochopaga TaxID=3140254 RepID=A0AAV9V3B9_9PEZI
MADRQSNEDQEPAKRPPKYYFQGGMAPNKAPGMEGDVELPAFFEPAATPAAATRTDLNVNSGTAEDGTSVHLLSASPTASLSSAISTPSTSSSLLLSSHSSSSNTIVLNPAATPFYPPPPYRATESPVGGFTAMAPAVSVGTPVEIPKIRPETPPETPPKSPPKSPKNQAMLPAPDERDPGPLPHESSSKLRGPKPEWVRLQLEAAASSKTAEAESPSFDGPPPEQKARREPDFPKQERQPIVTLSESWRQLPEVSVKLFRLPPYTTTYDLWVAFRDFSSIRTVDEIEIYENRDGAASGTGILRFRPPPKEAFWTRGSVSCKFKDGETHTLGVELQPSRRDFTIPSPVNPNIRYPERILIPVATLDFGFLLKEATMMSMATTITRGRDDSAFPLRASFEVNLGRRLVDVRFDLVFPINRGPIKPPYHMQRYRFRIPFTVPFSIHDTQADKSDPSVRSLMISLQYPPQMWRRIRDIESTHDQAGRSRRWMEWDAWFRQTNILAFPDDVLDEPVAIRKAKPVIDIGRWTTYHFAFKLTESQQKNFDLAIQTLKDFNIPLCQMPDFELVKNHSNNIWNVIDPPTEPTDSSSQSNLDLMQEVFSRTSLPFRLRYQLEACISHGCVSEYNLTEEFIRELIKLEDRDPGMAVKLLETIVDKEKRFFNPMEIFKEKRPSRARQHVPAYCVETRKATVTPTMVYYSNPTIEISNRVVRQYPQYQDRFLRVQFTDEKLHGKISATEGYNSLELFTRVKRAMLNGIVIGDRHFHFLAFGNSQLRQHGAYFFAETNDLKCDDIRKWMGKFDDIKIIAKYAARLGQCFSTTRAIHGFKVKDVRIPDVERNGFCFTDGCGTISHSAAQLIAAEFRMSSEEPAPSAFQFRLGGCKGILAVDPYLKKGGGSEASFQVCIRDSQRKFEAEHKGLEIIRCSAFSVATLNRQLIAVLSDLGLDDTIFLDRLHQQLSSLHDAMEDPRLALGLLRRYIDPNQATLRIARLILDGFMASKEPFLECLLHLWRTWSIKMLKEKARIAIDNGCFLLGVVDETATLKGHIEEEHQRMRRIRAHGGPLRKDLLPEIFVQVPDIAHKGQFKVIEGPCLLARNPSLHPGDLRVVNAVDCPKLRHLRNVVVLPQTGDRPIANMCSGGDLDGDDYIVIWDTDFLPLKVNEEPMDYTPPPPVLARSGRVTISDISTFFVNYMKNDTLGTIANAHLATADRLAAGVFSSQCLDLAALHSLAVDFPKTGQSAKMTKELRIRTWPHFFEKHPDNPNKTYQSVNILGQLYDAVEKVSFKPEERMAGLQFDERILGAFTDIDSKMLNVARDLKSRYDEALRRIMGQHGIGTEFEVWSTFVLSHVTFSSDYKFHEEIGEICNGLLDRFEREARAEVRTEDEYSLGRFAAAMYAVTDEEFRREMAKEDAGVPFISFPWIFARLLGKIAAGHGVFARSAATGTCVRPTEGQATKMPYAMVTWTKEPKTKIERGRRGEMMIGGERVAIEEKAKENGIEKQEQNEEKAQENGVEKHEQKEEEGEKKQENEKEPEKKEEDEGVTAIWKDGLPPAVSWNPLMSLEELLMKGKK